MRKEPAIRIKEWISENWPKASTITANNDTYTTIVIKDRFNTVTIRMKSEIDVYLPHVDDFRVCPACKRRHRTRHRQTSSYCQDCKGVKMSLLQKGISRKSMAGREDEYNMIVGCTSALKKLNKVIKQAVSNNGPN